MSTAIIRVAKIKTQSAALSKTRHNYREMNTPNADPERTATLNQELVNSEQKDYWSLAEQRIGEVVTRKVRADQVRAMEVLLTASPEAFKRDNQGQAADMRGSKWVESNLNFLKEKFGEKNLVSFTLHQDEKTPHIHAVVVPITKDNRLSADTLFNPKTLKQLQTDYAEAMGVHGLDRGTIGSRRQYEEMKQVYGRQTTTAAELAPLVQPAKAQAFTLEVPPLIGRDTWRAEQEAKINAEIARQVSAVSSRLQEVGKIAVAQAGAVERAEVLEKQLRTVEGLKQGNFEAKQQAEQALQQARSQYVKLAMHVVQEKTIPAATIEQVDRWRAAEVGKAQASAKQLLSNYQGQEHFITNWQARGYRYDQEKGIVHTNSGFRLQAAELHPQGIGAGTLGEVMRREEEGHCERQAQAQQAHQARQLTELENYRQVWSKMGTDTTVFARLVIPVEKLSQVKEVFSKAGCGVTADEQTGGLNVQYSGVHTAKAVTSLLQRAKELGYEVYEQPTDRQLREKGVVRSEQLREQERTQSREHKRTNRGIGR